MSLSRRQLIKHLGTLMSIAPLMATALPSAMPWVAKDAGNFRYVYGNAGRREHFRPFLKHVFHLYPEDRLDLLIAEILRHGKSDREIYTQVQQRLAAISPFLSELTYALPALNRQKATMAHQTSQLIGERKGIDGYLEFGSSGRYLDSLEELYEFSGGSYFVAEKQPTHSPADILDRGQFSVDGGFFPLDDYRVALHKHIPLNSLDLVTVYIGFHHCPPEWRDALVSSIRDVLKPGGMLVVRDHDAHDVDMYHCVALAHDVFNMGTHESWQYNVNERRHFYSLATLDAMLLRNGFRGNGKRLYQVGDPTLNALMLYRKA